jgi:hypothetical protein
VHQDSCKGLSSSPPLSSFFLYAGQRWAVKPPTARLAATEAVKETKDLRVGGWERAGSGEDAAIRRTKRDGRGCEVIGSALAVGGVGGGSASGGVAGGGEDHSSTTGNH